MGLFNKLFETKYCSICGNPIAVLGNKKLKDGNCCKKCEALLSTFFKERKQSTVAEVQYQLACRKKNVELLQVFCPTRTIGGNTKILVDETKGQFVVAFSKHFRNENADVIDCSSITDCSIDVVESRNEIKYRDSNDNIKSFNPPCYAYSYDFFIEITVNIPYIECIRFQLNDTPVDNGQETIIKIDGGLLGKLTDALITKSYNGMTSNAVEVKTSAQYQKYEQMAKDIREVLISNRQVGKVQHTSSTNKVTCPWCGTKVILDDSGICGRCGGSLD